MSDTYPTTPPEQRTGGNGYKGTYADNASVSYETSDDTGSPEIGRTLLVGMLGGILSAAGYLIYQRLPEEQKERLQSQAKSMLQQRINDIRQNFNV